MMQFMLVFIGGGFGSMCRFGLTKVLSNYKFNFPLATLLANIISCIILGYFIGLQLKNGISERNSLLLMTGFCGGFSTFSTFSGETLQLLQNGDVAIGLTYIAVSILVCLFCIWIGMKLS